MRDDRRGPRVDRANDESLAGAVAITPKRNPVGVDLGVTGRMGERVAVSACLNLRIDLESRLASARAEPMMVVQQHGEASVVKGLGVPVGHHPDRRGGPVGHHDAGAFASPMTKVETAS